MTEKLFEFADYARNVAICRQSVCPGSLGGDHDGSCPLFNPTSEYSDEDLSELAPKADK